MHGYLIAPPDLVDGFVAAHLSSGMHAPVIDQAVVGGLLWLSASTAGLHLVGRLREPASRPSPRCSTDARPTRSSATSTSSCRSSAARNGARYLFDIDLKDADVVSTNETIGYLESPRNLKPALPLSE
ncbi:hypothetical protein GCM10017786_01610 [Amycolatopsis deserti]|uniref:Uncharacterized protein n=1 Tax=Amycolatopsis deserti TaxID=185696 RepID=A0ABQ3ID28_9PSEU|nr:hypothetical protein GCM10017786_01610 [Amycolatopsis deserti]